MAKSSSFAMPWHHLPEGWKQALETLLEYAQRPEVWAVPEAGPQIQQVTQHYGQVLAKFIRLQQAQQQQRLSRQSKIVDLLRRVPLFQALSPFDLTRLAQKMVALEVPANTDLLVQGEPPEGVYFLEVGQVQILVNQEIVAHLGEGKCFGEMSCLRGEAYASATVRTLLPSQVLRIPRQDFLQIVNKSPQLWKSVFHEMTTRFREATDRLGELLQHNPQGLLKLNPQGQITNEFSTQCTRFFGTQNLAGFAFDELLFAHDSTARNDWNDVFPLFFEDIPMDFRQLADLLPRETLFQHPNGEERQYKLSYYACQSPNGQVVAIDVGLEDLTETRLLTRKSEALEAEKAILQRMYDNPDLFLNMLQLAAETLMQVRRFGHALDLDSQQLPSESFGEVMRLLHSLKGSSGMFLLNALKDAAHDMEDMLRQLKQAHELTIDHLLAFQGCSDRLEHASAYARSLVETMSEELRRRLTGVILPRELFSQFQTAARAKDYAQMWGLLRQVESVPARKMLAPWSQEIQRLAHRMGKFVQLQMQGEGLLIPQALMEKLDTPLLHLLRNAIDHGIESPEERLSLGKSETGTIFVCFEWQEDQLDVEVRDDGRGIDEERILEKAFSHPELDWGLVQSLVDQGEPWKILLLPGFSTASEITDVSGRGVGLDVVAKAIEELHGSLNVHSVKGEGCVFQLSFWPERESLE